MPMTRLTGWGRTAPSFADVVRPASAEAAGRAVAEAGPRGAIPRGLGRAYGDAAQNGGGTVVDCTALDRIGAIDDAGVIEVGGGTSLDTLARATYPQGWAPPVTPGTRFVTVGGAIASDVHGKNHHVDGSFSRHLLDFTLQLPSGEQRVVSAERDRALFDATTGGMGLTGVVVSARIRLRAVETRYVAADTRRTRNLADTMVALAETDGTQPLTAAWIDLLCGAREVGRGIVRSGHAAPLDALPAPLRAGALAYAPAWRPSLPVDAPNAVTSRTFVRALNALRYRRAEDRTGQIVAAEAFAAPLDGVGALHRLYGAAGLIQYQCALPRGEERALDDVVHSLAAMDAPATLAVLKRLGPGAGAPLSFPIEGWTLAVDFPAAALPAVRVILDRLDRRVAEAGGRVYLAKDARMRPEVVPLMYPRIEGWRAVQASVDPEGRLTSDLDRRLRLTAGSRR